MIARVLYQYPTDNVAPSAATIGVNTGSEDPDYPAAYLADARPGRPAKLTTTSGSWVFDFGAAQRVELVALGPHNLISATLEANDSNVWTSPALSVALTIPARTADGHSVNAWADLTGELVGSPDAFQYWRLVVAGSDPCSVGELWLGAELREFARAYRYGFTVGETHPAIAHRTEFLLPLVYALGSRQRQASVRFRMTAQEIETLLAWYRALKGPGLGGLFIPDAAVNDAWWVRQGQDWALEVPYPEFWDVAMTLVEHATGVPL